MGRAGIAEVRSENLTRESLVDLINTNFSDISSTGHVAILTTVVGYEGEVQQSITFSRLLEM